MRALAPFVLAGLSTLLIAPESRAAKKKAEKQDIEIQVFKRASQDIDEEEEDAISEGPRLKARDISRVFQAQAQAKRDEAIRVLKKIISETSNDDPQKAEYLFRLSELLWNKAKAFNLRAYGYDDKIWEAEKNDPARHEQLLRLKQEDLSREAQYRRDTLRVYEAIRGAFPDYGKMDRVLFYMGFNYKELGQTQEAQSAFKELIKKYPQSPFIPDALLAFGEFFFQIDQMAAAMKFYDKAARFKGSKVYGFAVYKRAWCKFNQGDFRGALADHLEVIRYSKEEGLRDKNRISLQNESTKDLVQAYSHIGTGAKAVPFFRKVAPDHWAKLSAKLAKMYTLAGKTRDANDLYRRLIRLNKSKPEIIDYEYAIARNVEKIGDNATTTLETKRLVALFSKLRAESKLKGDKLKESSRKVSGMVRELATTWHREAQVTKNDQLLNYAQEMYRLYVAAFPQLRDIYLMTFYYAELLYRLGKWQDAATAYDKVISLDPKGKYARDAAHAAVLAYQKLLDLSERAQRRADAPAKKGKKGKKGKTEEVAAPVGPPAKKEIGGAAKAFLVACDNYIRLVPKGERGVDVHYYAALTYYNHNHFDEAIPRFEAIIRKYPKHRLSYFSANLVLDSHNLQGSFEELSEAVSRFIKIPQIARGKLLEDLQTLQEEAAFNACGGMEAKGQNRKAADCYVKFASEFTTSKFFDKALNNAALNFERENLVERSIGARMALIKQRPDSPLVPKTLFAIAGNLHASAVYSQAARYYELYAKQYPDKNDACPALQNAAVFRRGLEQYDKAIDNYKQWIRRCGRKKPKQAAEVDFALGAIYQKQGKSKEVIDHYEYFLRKWSKQASNDNKITAHTELGLAYKGLKGKRAKKASQKHFEQAVKVFNGIPEKKRKKLVDGREAAAQARFMQGEELFKDFRDLKVDSPKKIAEQIGTKIEALKKSAAAYQSVIEFGHPNWSIAAFGRAGAGFQELAKAIRGAPPPPGLDEEEILIYEDEVDQQASVFDGQAAENYVTVLQLAAKAQWFNEHVGKAETELQRLRPSEYSLAGELRPGPGFRAAGFRSTPFQEEALEP